jgi:hypothetical protein
MPDDDEDPVRTHEVEGFFASKSWGAGKGRGTPLRFRRVRRARDHMKIAAERSETY